MGRLDRDIFRRHAPVFFSCFVLSRKLSRPPRICLPVPRVENAPKGITDSLLRECHTQCLAILIYFEDFCENTWAHERCE